jgi:DNA-binding MarR family transcriptional regulator
MPLPIYELILDIRAAFRALRVVSDRMNEARGITAARRAVMEHLAENGPVTVPQIARVKASSRQNIQIIADELVAQGLADWSENPAHRRSQRLGLSEKGVAAFSEIKAEEEVLLAQLQRKISRDTILAGRTALGQLMSGLDKIQATSPKGNSGE